MAEALLHPLIQLATASGSDYKVDIWSESGGWGFSKGMDVRTLRTKPSSMSAYVTFVIVTQAGDVGIVPAGSSVRGAFKADTLLVSTGSNVDSSYAYISFSSSKVTAGCSSSVGSCSCKPFTAFALGT